MRRLLCGVLVITASLVFASSASASFGLERFSQAATNRDGSPDVQAGSHPYALTTTFTMTKPSEVEGELLPQGNLKDVRDELPPGFVGDPNATPKCSYDEFIGDGCPNDTVVGVETSYFSVSSPSYVSFTSDPVYNVEPSPGVAAEFGFKAAGIIPVFLDASVRTGGDYGITVNVKNITEGAAIYASKVTIWGVPAEASHNAVRGTCINKGQTGGHEEEPGLGVGEDEQEVNVPVLESTGECPVDIPVVPLLTNPTSCATSRTATLSVDSWEEPGQRTFAVNVDAGAVWL